MQELVIVTSCDVHMVEDEVKVPAHEVLWSVGGVPWVVDLCDDHQDSLRVSEIGGVTEKYGRPLTERRAEQPKTPPVKTRGKAKVRPDPVGIEYAADGRVLCPWPDCGRSYKNKFSMTGHFKQDHGVRWSNWYAEQRGISPTYFCSCGEKFMESRALSNHINSSRGENHAAIG